MWIEALESDLLDRVIEGSVWSMPEGTRATDEWRRGVTDARRDITAAVKLTFLTLAPIDGLALVQELRAESETRHQLHLEQVRITNEWIADRDRIAAANAALEARVAGLVEAAEDAEYDLLQWLECSKALTAAGFNMDGTAEVTAKLTAALSHIKRGKTNG